MAVGNILPLTALLAHRQVKWATGVSENAIAFWLRGTIYTDKYKYVCITFMHA